MQESDAFMPEAYRQYITEIAQVATELQRRCEQAHCDYVAAVRDACASKCNERLLEDAFRSYMKAVLEVWGAEETQQKTQQAYLEYIQEVCGPAGNGRDLEERRMIYERTLRDALSPEVAAQCLNAYRNYIQALKSALEQSQH